MISLRLQNNITIDKSDCIIQRADTWLVNECIRNIHNTIDHFEQERYMYSEKFCFNPGSLPLQECELLINKVKETRNVRVLECHKIEKLWQNKYYSGNQFGSCNNSSSQPKQIQDSIWQKWVINLLNTPLTETQETFLVHGPNYAVSPRTPIMGNK